MLSLRDFKDVMKFGLIQIERRTSSPEKPQRDRSPSPYKVIQHDGYTISTLNGIELKNRFDELINMSAKAGDNPVDIQFKKSFAQARGSNPELTASKLTRVKSPKTAKSPTAVRVGSTKHAARKSVGKPDGQKTAR